MDIAFCLQEPSINAHTTRHQCIDDYRHLSICLSLLRILLVAYTREKLAQTECQLLGLLLEVRKTATEWLGGGGGGGAVAASSLSSPPPPPSSFGSRCPSGY